jgi:hypothetical protein
VSPQLALARTLEKSPHIKSVFISIEWANGAIARDFSAMGLQSLSTHQVNVQQAVTEIWSALRRQEDDNG